MTLTRENLRTETVAILDFIERMWVALTGNARQGHHDSFDSWKAIAATSTDGHLGDTDHNNPYIIYLPNDYVYPGGRFIVQFYWDSYFIILSLLRFAKTELAKGMVENCFYLIGKYGLVVANRRRWAAGSQLPFLSEMVLVIYQVEQNKLWLEKARSALEIEYRGYWLNQDHLVYRGLSRYHAPPYFPKEYIAAITLDNEATWDLSPRFDLEDVLNLLPVDLNCNLFAYERNCAYFYSELNRHDAR